MSEFVTEYSISVEQVDGYEFRVRFDKPHFADLAMDEPPPLGKDKAPSAGRILAAAIGNCLSASFLFAAKKNSLDISGIRAQVRTGIVRNENRRFRIGRIEVSLDPGPIDDVEKAKAAAAVFEDFCTVTASVRQGIPVQVSVQGITA